MHYEHSIDISASPEAAFAVIADVERWPAWTVTMTTVRRLEQGPFGVGSRARIKQPKLLPATWRVTAYDPPRGFAWETSMPGMHILADHRVEATSGGCRVTLSLDASGPLTGLMALLTSAMTTRYVQIEAASLKRVVEAGHLA